MTVWVPGKGRVANYMLPVQEFDRPLATGDGITRTTATHTQLYHLLIWFSATKTMRCSIRASSKAQAEQFARNRHPTLSRLEFAT
jgi:hypothetical protein